MSVRQDKENKNCSNRGLGIAAAAIGVGVGAALYYFFSKRQEPDNDGATTSGWNCEPHALSDSSFTTLSEHSTTDTSMNETLEETHSSFTSSSSESEDSDSESDSSLTDPDSSLTELDSIVTELNNLAARFDSSMTDLDSSVTDSESSVTDLTTDQNSSFLNNSVDSETGMEWDVTNSSIDVPSEDRRGMGLTIFNAVLNGIRRAKNRHRDRDWKPEECAICFDMMSTQQEVMSLPCTHRFHQTCILCWLEQKQTCPVCRKLA